MHGEHLAAPTRRGTATRAIHSTACGRGALAHADHHRAVADRLHVAALDVAAAPVLVGAAQPDRELLGGEHRVEPVDGLHDHRLRLAGRLGHRVERDAVEDPARRVALEQEVRQRRQQHARRVGRLPDQPDVLRRTSALVIPPIRKSATCGGVGRLRPTRGPAAAALMPTSRSLRMCSHDPVLGLGLGQRLGEQRLGLEHLDAALAHHLAERVVLGLGPLDPQHVVEQQLLGVRRRQAGVLQPRPVDHAPCAACRPRNARRTPSPPPRSPVSRHLRTSQRAGRRHAHTRGG